MLENEAKAKEGIKGASSGSGQGSDSDSGSGKDKKDEEGNPINKEEKPQAEGEEIKVNPVKTDDVTNKTGDVEKTEQNNPEETKKEGESSSSSSSDENKKDDQNQDNSSSSSSNTSDSSDTLTKIKLKKLKDFGRILGISVLKIKKKQACCSCSCYHKDPNYAKCINMIENLQKYYHCFRVIQTLILSYLAWAYQQKPGFHLGAYLFTQILFFVYVALTRPFQTCFMNFSAVFIEFLFLNWIFGLFLLNSKTLDIFGIGELGELVMNLVIGMMPIFVVIIVVVVYLQGLVKELIGFCIRMSKRDDEEE